LLTTLQLLQGGRRDQAESTLSEVRDRNEAIRQVEQDLIELAQMFQDLDSVVVQQEAAVENIDQRGEDVQQNVEQANVQLDGAINSANAARKKKFWCLGIACKSCSVQLQDNTSSLLQFLFSSSLLLLWWLLFWCYESRNFLPRFSPAR
jgi:t-SNARE complex subunit (syntaxin)